VRGGSHGVGEVKCHSVLCWSNRAPWRRKKIVDGTVEVEEVRDGVSERDIRLEVGVSDDGGPEGTSVVVVVSLLVGEGRSCSTC
jgi:hypothetical protein